MVEFTLKIGITRRRWRSKLCKQTLICVSCLVLPSIRRARLKHLSYDKSKGIHYLLSWLNNLGYQRHIEADKYINTDEVIRDNASWQDHQNQLTLIRMSVLVYGITCAVYCHYEMLNKEAFGYWQLGPLQDSVNYSCCVYVRSMAAASQRSSLAFIASFRSFLRHIWQKPFHTMSAS